MHPNTLVSSVNEHLVVIRYFVAIIVMQIQYSLNFVKARQPRQGVVYIMQNLRLSGRPHQSFLHG